MLGKFDICFASLGGWESDAIRLTERRKFIMLLWRGGDVAARSCAQEFERMRRISVPMAVTAIDPEAQRCAATAVQTIG
jgi:hypothetical protein